MQIINSPDRASTEEILPSPHFLFFSGENLELMGRIRRMSRDWFTDSESINYPGLFLVAPKIFIQYNTASNEQLICGVTGWARSLNLPPVNFQIPASFRPHLLQVAKGIIAGWPLSSTEITGNFSGIVFDKFEHRLMIYSDPGSIFPIYYATGPFGWVGGTHLLLLARILEREIDITGVVERLSPPTFINYGSRTIFQGIKRVLPGECIAWGLMKNEVQKNYDNTFYGGEANKSDLHEQAGEVWDDYKADILACVGETPHINLGLSGGWDSRLVAAALTSRSVSCFTYAVEKNEYEVQVAEKVARLINAEFFFIDFSTQWTPKKDRFLQNILSTESTYIPEWLAILDRFSVHTLEPFLLGDLFEAVTGRYLQRLSSRTGKKQLYLDRALGKIEVPRTKGGDFKHCRDRQMESIRKNASFAMSILNKDVIAGNLRSKILDDVENDVNDLFLRISSHEILYSDAFDEMFAWYSKCNAGIGKQIITLNERFFGLNPTMSFRSLRRISAIHPFTRASGQLMSHIQRLPDFNGLSRIPNANAPFAPSSIPLWLSDLIWAARSTTDQWLIKRALSQRNKNARMRVMKTFNMVHLYNMPEALSNVSSWFSGKFFQPDVFLKSFSDRAKMESWPLCNYDITGPAGLSLILDLVDMKENS